MSNELTIGSVLDGRVSAIKEYGAFISLSPSRSGLVHISQIANEFVKSVEDYLNVGDTVQVKVIDISETGKISLSIKQVAPLKRKDGIDINKAPHKKYAATENKTKKPMPAGSKDRWNSLEDKLKKWMKSSEERIQELQAKQKRK